MTRNPLLLVIITLALAGGCDRKPPADSGGTPATNSGAQPPANDDGHGGHGAPIELGAVKIGAFDVRAARDWGDIVAGGDAPIDVWITGGTTKVTAVRFWIGVADARGSMKVRAEIEDPAQPSHWHTHVELPAPLPDDCELWVEIETDAGATVTGSFDLKRDAAAP